MAVHTVVLHQAVWSGPNNTALKPYPRPGITAAYLAMRLFEHTLGSVIACETTPYGALTGPTCALIYCTLAPQHEAELLHTLLPTFQHDPALKRAVYNKDITYHCMPLPDVELSHPFNEAEFNALYAKVYAQYAVYGMV